MTDDLKNSPEEQMNMIELREKDRKAITALAKKHLVKGTELRAYGSRVKGTSLETSDLDLMMFTPEGQTNDLLEFQQALAKFQYSPFLCRYLTGTICRSLLKITFG